MEISIFVKSEEAPALNFLIRVLTPAAYIIVVSTTLYYFGLDKYVKNIFLVNIYYIIFRLLFNILTNRGLLLNWYKQLLYWGAIIIISYFIYDKLIKVRANILPDFSTVANELWIIILIFLFQIANNIRLSQDGTIKRKHNYLKSRYVFFKNIYGGLIKEITRNEVLEAVTYAILIYEDFNRPKLIRQVEYLRFRLTNKPHTLGVMQVLSDKLLSDKESVILGANKVVEAHNKYLNKDEEEEHYYYEWSVISEIIADYNSGTSYTSEVMQLATTIREEFYNATNDTLDRKKSTNLPITEIRG
jgi:hypothetical protein